MLNCLESLDFFLSPSQQPSHLAPVDDKPWMLAFGKLFHHAVLPVLCVQLEGEPYQRRSSYDAETDTNPLIDARHVEEDEEDEHGQQPTGEDEQVLTFQPFELDAFADSFIDVILHHIENYRKKERRMVAATIRKMHAPNQLAAVLLVSGSPELNLL